MRKFLAKHAATTTGTLSCFDRLLFLRGLVAKIPRSRHWRVTQLGHAVMSAAILLREEEFPAVFVKTAA